MSMRRDLQGRGSGYQPGDIWLSFMDIYVVISVFGPIVAILLSPFILVGLLLWWLVKFSFLLMWWAVKYAFLIFCVWIPRSIWQLVSSSRKD